MGDRLASLDQFRGYTVLGMFVVNFAGHFLATPEILKHHKTYCSFADTIMPQFFFAVGFAYRMTFLRRLGTDGAWPTHGRFLRRCLGLILLGAVLYHMKEGVKSWAELRAIRLWDDTAISFVKELFQTLVHIGVTSLWMLPWMGSRSIVLALAAVASAAAHAVLSHLFYYDWAMEVRVIDGGPLGFLTWTLPLVAGALAYDAIAARPGRPPVGGLLACGAVLMVVGYLMSCINGWVEPPFVAPSRPASLWSMSQRAGSVSYLTFGTGFSLAVYSLFVWACDVRSFRLGLFATLGSNALAAYVLHDLVADSIQVFAPEDSPIAYVAPMVLLYVLICYLFVRHLEKQRIFIRM